jgi:hypothetical protein
MQASGNDLTISCNTLFHPSINSSSLLRLGGISSLPFAFDGAKPLRNLAFRHHWRTAYPMRLVSPQLRRCCLVAHGRKSSYSRN